MGDGCTGDGFNKALSVDASVANMENVAGNASYLNQFNGADCLKHERCALVQPRLRLNPDGERFCNEPSGSLFVNVFMRR